MKKVIVTFLIFALAVCSVFANGEKEAAATAGPRTVIAAHTGNERTTYQVGMLQFKESVERLTNGRFQVDVYPATLGGDKVLMESLQIGSVDFAEINTSVLASIVPELSIFDLPYIFGSREHTYAVYDGEIGDHFRELTAKKTGLVPVAYWEYGFRCFTNDVRPIKTPADLKGIKMRSMQNNIHLQAFRLWGADPSPMGFNEMLTAMQQGVIQGHDNNIDTIVNNSMWEYQKYFSESWHFFGGKMLIFSSKFWNSLSPEDQKLFSQAVIEARDAERKACADRYENNLKKLAEGGMNIVYRNEMDTAAFVESVQSIWADYKKQYGTEYIDKIVALK